MINASVERNQNESASSVIRRFTKRVQDSGILPRVRSLKEASRTLSYYKKKKATLEVIKRRSDMEKLAKLGKLPARGNKK
jgi:ribosomal protein S21